MTHWQTIARESIRLLACCPSAPAIEAHLRARAETDETKRTILALMVEARNEREAA